MLDALLAARSQLRPKIEAVSGAVLYVGSREVFNTDGTIKPIVFPHGWLRLGNENRESRTLGRQFDTAYLDLYGRSLAELAKLEDAAAFMDDVQFSTLGNAINPRYLMSSKTYLQEAADRHHTTVLYEIRYGDKRKLLAG